MLKEQNGILHKQQKINRYIYQHIRIIQCGFIVGKSAIGENRYFYFYFMQRGNVRTRLISSSVYREL